MDQGFLEALDKRDERLFTLFGQVGEKMDKMQVALGRFEERSENMAREASIKELQGKCNEIVARLDSLATKEQVARLEYLKHLGWTIVTFLFGILLLGVKVVFFPAVPTP